MQNISFERARATPGRRRPARRKALRCASLLLGTSFVFHAVPAWADNECGPPPPGGGTVICPAGHYPNGIYYFPPSDLEVVLQPGVVSEGVAGVTSHNDIRFLGPVDTQLNSSLGLYTDNGTVFAHVDDVRGSLSHAFAVYIRGEGSITLFADTVVSIGKGVSVQEGAWTDNFNSPGTHVRINSVTTAGTHSPAVDTNSIFGPVRTEIGSITTTGYAAIGIESGGGIYSSGTFIKAGTIATTGDVSTGIRASGFHLDVQSGSISTSGLQALGIESYTTRGNTTIVSDSIVTQGSRATGIQAWSSETGDIDITSGSVSTLGGVPSGPGQSTGIHAKAVEGDITISSGSVSTAGAQSDGIRATTEEGSVAISSGTLSTTGAASTGIVASSSDGDVRIVSGTIATQGARSPGIRASSNGSTSITSNLVTTSGNDSDAIMGAAVLGEIVIRSGAASTTGLRAFGIRAEGTDSDIRIFSDSLTTRGTDSLGIRAEAVGSGDISVTSQDIGTTGDNAPGIFATAAQGAVAVTNTGTLSTGGANSAGIRAAGGTGAAVTNTGTVITGGAGSAGILATGSNVAIRSAAVGTEGDGSAGLIGDATGDIDVASEGITTLGSSSTGIFARSSGGDVGIVSGAIATTGASSIGLHAIAGGSGDIDIASDSVATSGDDSRGILATSSSGDIAVESGEVTTLGQGLATGIDARSSSGDVSVTSGKVEVSGNSAAFGNLHGIIATSNGGNVLVDSGTVSTAGALSVGIYADSATQQVTVIADDTRTTGDSANAILALSNSGGVSVNSGLASTAGANAVAIQAFANGGGDSIVVANRTSTRGPASDAINALSFGHTSVTSSNATTEGADSDAIQAVTIGGSLDILSGAVSTAGPRSIGINGSSEGGNIRIVSDSAATAGSDSAGIRAAAVQSGDVSVVSREVRTGGDNSLGIYASAAQGRVAVTNGGTVSTSGKASTGILAESRAGPIGITSGSVVTTGGSTGIEASTSTGAIKIVSGSVATSGSTSQGSSSGRDGTGIYAHSRTGSIAIEAGSVTAPIGVGIFAQTGGEVAIKAGTVTGRGLGILALGDGAITVEAGNVITPGGTGIFASGVRGPVSVTVDTVSAVTGVSAFNSEGSISVKSNSIATQSGGILTININGDTTIVSGEVKTTGPNGIGIRASVDNFGGRLTGSGDVTVISRDVTTQGENSGGIRADVMTGVAAVTSTGIVATSGPNSVGIHASGGTVGIDSAAISTFGANSRGIEAIATGNVDVASDSIITRGPNSTGIFAESRSGNIGIASGSVVTTGGSIGIDASTSTGDIKIVSGSIATSRSVAGGPETGFLEGAGIYAHSGNGNISVESGSVTTAARQAFGIFATSSGIVNVVSGSVATAGNLANGLFAVSMGGAVKVTSGGPIVTQGDSATGIVTFVMGSGATSVKTGSISTRGFDSYGVIATSTGTGAVDVTSDGNIVTTGASSPGISAESAGQVTVSANNVSVSGADSDAIAVKGSTSRVTIRGLVESSQGFAVRGEGGLRQRSEPGGPVTVDILGGGTLRGRVSLTGGADRVANGGIFDAIGTSRFGAGADSFDNGPGATLRSMNGAAVFAELESFGNAGLIDLRDGAVNDSLTLSGAYSGIGGSLLGLDVDLTAGTADRLVTGAATGSTKIDLRVTGQAAGLTSSILLVDAGAGTSATAFSLGGGVPDTVYLRSALRFDPAGNDFFLVQAPGTAVFETSRFAGMATGLWQESADAVAAQLDSARDGRDRPGLALWLQGWTGEDESRGSQTFAGETFDVAYDQDFQGLQGGLDYRTGPIELGVTAGAGRSDAVFAATGNPVEMEARNIGAYIQGDFGPLFFNALAKFDWAELEIAPGAGLGASFDADLFGVQANAGVRLDFGSVFAEPSVGLSWVQSEVEAFASGAATVGPGEGESLRARAGLRIGAELALGGGALLPFVAVDAYEELGGRNSSDFTLGETLRLFDEPGGTRGRAAAGLSFVAAGFEAFVRGERDFSGGADAKTVRVGARLRF